MSIYYKFGLGGLNCLQRHLMGPNWPPRTLPWGVLKGSRGSKLKLKDIWHVGCLFSAILAKELVFDFKEIFLDQTGPPGPFLWGL